MSTMNGQEPAYPGWNLAELCAAARMRSDRRGERPGQSLYNEAYARNPAVAHLAGTACDPFYDDTKMEDFLAELSKPREGK